MMKLKKYSFLFLMIYFVQTNFSCAQTTLTLKAAIDSALLNNLGIQISKNNAQIAANNTAYGNAGFLPYLNVNAAAQFGKNSLRQETSTGIVTDKDNVDAKTYSANAELGWTIFNGAKMFATYNRLKALKELGEVQLKMQITETVFSVAVTYYDLVRQQQLVQKTLGTINLYEERKRLADRKLALGNSPKTELLQASVDYNTQQSNLLQLKNNLRNAQIQLTQILMHSPEEEILASDTLNPDSTLIFGNLLNILENGNLDLQEQLLLSEVANDQLKESKADYYPVIDINASYDYNNTIASQGLYLKNRVVGPSAGAQLSWNIFNGGYQQRQIKNAKLNMLNAELNVNLVRQSAVTSLSTAWNNYQGSVAIYKNELQSEQMALQNLDIMSKRFRLNESDVLELRTAQQTVEEVQIRLANALFNTNISIIQLKQLTGILLN